MTPLRLLPGLLLLAACGDAEAPAPPVEAPAPAPTDASFDAAAWMQRAAAVWDSTTWAASNDSALTESRERALELDQALRWRDVCDFPADALTDTTSGWGIMHRYLLSPDEYVVSISCELFAYQGTLVLVHVAGRQARLISAEQFDETGAPRDTSALFIGLERVDAPSRTFSMFTRARGAGDCGTMATYRLSPAGEAETASVRVRECIDVREDEVEVPEQWPVVYPRG